MKLLLTAIISTLFLTACATKEKSKEVASALSLSPELIFDLTKTNQCEGSFWYSKYGNLVSVNAEKKSFDTKTFFSALDQRPSACSISQAISSAAVLSKIKNHIIKSPILKDSVTENIKRLRSVQNSIVKVDLTLSELILENILFEEMVKQLSSKKELAPVISEIKKDIFQHQDEILAKTIKHESIVMQNLIYRMELLDWTANNQLGGELKIPTKAELESNSKYNKFDQILLVEEFKKALLQNQKCLSDQTCYLCYANIQSNKCVEEKLMQEVELQKYNGSLFLPIMAAKFQEGIIKFKNSVKQFDVN